MMLSVPSARNFLYIYIRRNKLKVMVKMRIEVEKWNNVQSNMNSKEDAIFLLVMS